MTAADRHRQQAAERERVARQRGEQVTACRICFDLVADDRANFLALVGSLLDTYQPYGVVIWLKSRNQHLGGMRPEDLIARGEWEPLLAEADRLAGGPRG